MFPFVKFDLEEIWIKKNSLLRQLPKDAWTQIALKWDIKWDEAKEQTVTIIFIDVPRFKLQYFWAVAWDHGRSRTRKDLNGFHSCRDINQLHEPKAPIDGPTGVPRVMKSSSFLGAVGV
ncbi:hypothetical protein V3481_000878 [Fusarium oxysporum f. sp. vasinfectum]